jgi:TRAP-type C4-dicarboxylate transport system permease large subunit
MLSDIVVAHANALGQRGWKRQPGGILGGSLSLYRVRMPIMMILGIKFGIATPTEVSSLAVRYGLIIATVGYRALALKGLTKILIDSGRLTGMVLFIMAAAGALLEGLPAIIILAPVLMPIANQPGIDSIHYAMVIILSIGVGVFMPPVGIGFYIACAVVHADIDQASRAILPYIAMLCVGVLLIAFVPWFTHALPSLLAR